MSYLRDMKFLRSWLFYDSELDADSTAGKFNWNFLIGMGVAGAISAGFWAGLGLAIAGALR